MSFAGIDFLSRELGEESCQRDGMKVGASFQFLRVERAALLQRSSWQSSRARSTEEECEGDAGTMPMAGDRMGPLT
jgi:hypothetical protein